MDVSSLIKLVGQGIGRLNASDRTLNLAPGDFLQARVARMLSPDMAEIWIQGFKLLANTSTPLEPGQNLTLQVLAQTAEGLPELQIVSTQQLLDRLEPLNPAAAGQTALQDAAALAQALGLPLEPFVVDSLKEVFDGGQLGRIWDDLLARLQGKGPFFARKPEMNQRFLQDHSFHALGVRLLEEIRSLDSLDHGTQKAAEHLLKHLAGQQLLNSGKLDSPLWTYGFQEAPIWFRDGQSGSLQIQFVSHRNGNNQADRDFSSFFFSFDLPVLGQLDINAQILSKTVSMRLYSDTLQQSEMVQTEMDQLRADLEQAGFRLGSVRVENRSQNPPNAFAFLMRCGLTPDFSMDFKV